MAHASLLGIGHHRLLRTRSRLEFMVEQQVTQRAVELAEVRDQNLAINIANNLGKVLGG